MAALRPLLLGCGLSEGQLQSRLDGDATLKAAFEALTPGRQREYRLQISGAKQTKTRQARVEKYIPKILNGKGFRDR